MCVVNGDMNTATLLAAVICVTFMIGQGQAAGAGRAFPVESENYAIEQFQRVNPRIEWDPSNFLVDLAGSYANCNNVGRRGKITVDRTTPEGHTIVGVVDSTVGGQSDVNAVNSYIKTILDRWTYTHEFDSEIRQANKFGCSVRPACSGQVVVSCLFSQGVLNVVDCNRNPSHPDCQHQDTPGGEPKALAFTAEQYRLAEQITGQRWDRSHYLENLSGQETDCAMIGARDWPFTTATSHTNQMGMRVSGVYGWTENRGSTPAALRIILTHFKEIPRSRAIGCSVIPDCVVGTQMYVVASCLYQESFLK